MQVIHTEIPWRRWLRATLAMLPRHDSLAELARWRAREFHVANGQAAVFVECKPLEPLETLWPLAETGTPETALAQLAPGDRVVISVDQSECFSHQTAMPRSAFADIESILDLERARLTPFTRGEVFSAWVPNKAGQAAATISVRHILLKRSAVGRIGDLLRVRGTNPIAVVVRNSGSPALNFAIGMDGKPFGTKAVKFWSRAAAATAFALAASVTVLVLELFGQQSNLLVEIETRSAQLAKSANIVQERLKAISGESAEVSAAHALVATRQSVVAAIEALSAELPDATSLDGLTYANGTATITGTSESPEPLVELLEESPAFAEAGFSAPVFKNPGEARSHFTLTLKLESQKDASP